MPGGDGRYLDVDVPGEEDGQELVRPETPAAEADGGTEGATKGTGLQKAKREAKDGDQVTQVESTKVGAANSREPEAKVGTGNEVLRQRMLEEKQAKVAARRERQEKKEAQFEAAKQKLIKGVRETRESVRRLREDSIRAGKTEEEYEGDAQKLVEKRAEQLDQSDMELILKQLLKRITIPHTETTEGKFAYLVGLGMNRDLPGGKMRYWSKENYLNLYAKKVGKKVEHILDEERQTVEAEYDALDEALAELERETAPEETELKAAA